MTGQDTVAGLGREVAGGIAFLRRAGEARARTVLLLHGIGSNASSFAALATAMPD
jgi:predicted esterase